MSEILRPGTRAPRTGVYEAKGSHTVLVRRGGTLPPAPFLGGTWELKHDAAELARLEEEDLAGQPTAIFVVHGRDVALREQVARFLERATGKEVVVLHEKASGGRTLVEKVEYYARRSSFAVVLMTADDSGGPRRQLGETDDQFLVRLNLRARQNVILELGFFIGQLGRPRVAVLIEPGVEKPSDVDGIAYIAADAAGGWRTELIRELEGAGFEVDRRAL
jgi:predicted nucleotide-binding protein